MHAFILIIEFITQIENPGKLNHLPFLRNSFARISNIKDFVYLKNDEKKLNYKI
jgi:hypothetical protein